MILGVQTLVLVGQKNVTWMETITKLLPEQSVSTSPSRFSFPLKLQPSTCLKRSASVTLRHIANINLKGPHCVHALISPFPLLGR